MGLTHRQSGSTRLVSRQYTKLNGCLTLNEEISKLTEMLTYIKLIKSADEETNANTDTHRYLDYARNTTKIVADDTFIYFFFLLLSKKIRLDVSCESSA